MPGIHDLQGYMDALCASFDAVRSGGRNVTLQYVFSGSVTGACYAAIAHENIRVSEGTCPAPTVTVFTDFDLWLRVIAYHLDPLMAYQDGLYRVEGDIEVLIESDTWFRR